MNNNESVLDKFLKDIGVNVKDKYVDQENYEEDKENDVEDISVYIKQIKAPNKRKKTITMDIDLFDSIENSAKRDRRNFSAQLSMYAAEGYNNLEKPNW